MKKISSILMICFVFGGSIIAMISGDIALMLVGLGLMNGILALGVTIEEKE